MHLARLLLLFFLLAAGAARAQETSPAAWPHDSAGQVSFRGRLLWPDSVRSEASRQTLVRRWFLAKLTDMEAARQAYLIAQSGTTFGQIPHSASLRLDTNDHEGREEVYQLIFLLDFVPTPTALEYQLSDFEVLYAGTDTGSTLLLENVLATAQLPPTQQALASFRQRLGAALAGW